MIQDIKVPFINFSFDNVSISDLFAQVDWEKLTTVAERFVNVDKEFVIIEDLGIKDAFVKRNKAIEEADIPWEEKSKYYDQSMDIYERAMERVMDMKAKERARKVEALGKAVTFTVGFAALSVLGLQNLPEQLASVGAEVA